MVEGSKIRRLSIGHFPDDCWYLIFKKLGSKHDQDSFGLTCRRFLDIQNSSVKHLELGCLIKSKCSCYPIDPFTIQKLLIRFRELDSLSLGSCNIQVSDSALTPLLTNGSKLHYLWLDFCHDITAIGFTLVASGCPLLSVISLCKCSITDSGLEILAKSCSSLTEVNISRCQNITDRGILSLNQNCRQLRTLKLSHCRNITGVGFQGFSRTMACLEADHCAFDSTGVTGILSGGGLRYLNVSCSLKHTRVHGLTSIGLGLGANIEVLNLSYCKLLEDDTIIKISKGCPVLQEWNLSYCSKIAISGW
ncbi:RNI-like superfamily protein [Artemisia annua]|uniref:RNI-like superfamily protein n=1 Tax=Artemisia annua TaxID=35608 RepID=A0A2U1LVT1_ARTAN|nr:RNI-like superfamily protein [Artemisia annua]